MLLSTLDARTCRRNFMLPEDFAFGYCTNVHAGATIEQTRANLDLHAVQVKQQFSLSRPMGIGLWLSANAARELQQTDGVGRFADWLGERGLVPYTFNGFPFGDFHEPVVKLRVYEPTWWHAERLEYTCRLADIMHGLLPAGLEGSISTLPIAWGNPCPNREQLQEAAENLRRIALHLHALEEQTGRLIYLCLEPEPGCALTFADDAVHFFEWHLFQGEDEELARRHLRICHDICHAAVMFEEQEEVLAKYQAAGIAVGKIQVSAALRMDLDRAYLQSREAAAQALAQLKQFVEPRYLHQTVVRGESFYEDLQLALAAEAATASGEWRVHFHVPIYLQRLGLLESTQEQISEGVAAARQFTACQHYEVETYAWSVLPEEHRPATLSAGIAQEMQWFDRLWSLGEKAGKNKD